MLPTEGRSNLYINRISQKLEYENECKIRVAPAQHLYILSDEEIKVGDWYISNQAPRLCVEIRRYTKYPYGHKNHKGETVYDFHTWKTKVIATTNPELILPIQDNGESDYKYLPQIPKGFIQEYIKDYNDGNPIKEVWVEYEKTSAVERSKIERITGYRPVYIPKLNPGNTIIIHKAEEKMYSRKELYEALYKFNDSILDAYSQMNDKEFIEWFDKNYPE